MCHLSLTASELAEDFGDAHGHDSATKGRVKGLGARRQRNDTAPDVSLNRSRDEPNLLNRRLLVTVHWNAFMPFNAPST